MYPDGDWHTLHNRHFVKVMLFFNLSFGGTREWQHSIKVSVDEEDGYFPGLVWFVA